MAAQNFRGDSLQTQLKLGINATVDTMTVDDGSTYPSSNFTIVLGRGTVTEEKVFVGSNSGVGGIFTGCIRGWDDTNTFDHGVDTTVDHVLTAEWCQRVDQLMNQTIIDLTPAGVISAFAGPIAPFNHVLCDGRELDGTNSNYARLYAVIGNTYGGNTAAAFNVPNLQGKVIVMHDPTQIEFDSLGEGAAYGEKRVALSPNEMVAHQHSVQIPDQTVTVTLNDAGHGHSIPRHAHNIDHSHGAINTTGGVNHGHGLTGKVGSDDIGHKHPGSDTGGRFVVESGSEGVEAGIQAPGGTGYVRTRDTNWGTPAHKHDLDNLGSTAAVALGGTHEHSINIPQTSGWGSQNDSPNIGATGGGANISVTSATVSKPAAFNTVANAVATVPHNNLQPYLTLNYIIRL